MATLGLLLACQGERDTAGAPAPVDTRDTAPPVDTDDTAAEATAWFFTDFTFVQSDVVPSVVTVSWHTAQPALCTLSYGAEGILGLTTVEAGTPSTRHEVSLVGVRPSSAGGLVVTAEAATGPMTSAAQAFTTGALSQELPTFELEITDPERAFQGFTLVPLIDDRAWLSWICVMDAEGVVIWAYPTRHGANRARLAPDGGGVVFIDVDTDPESEVILGAVYDIAWDGTERWRLERNDLHHDFAILGDDRYVALGTTARTYDEGLPTERRLRGDTLIEFDSAGDAEVIWDVFDALDPDLVPTTSTGEDPGTGTWDWSHANYLTWVPETGELLVVFRELDAIVAMNPDTGEITWSLANDWGTYQPSDGQPLLSAPHSVELIPGGLALFSQTVFPFGDDCSWGSEVTLDAEQGTATETWRYETEDCAQVSYLGSTHPLPNGDELVVFSQASVMDEVTLEGGLVRRLRSVQGWTIGYAHEAIDLRPVAN